MAYVKIGNHLPVVLQHCNYNCLFLQNPRNISDTMFFRKACQRVAPRATQL